MAAPRDRDDLLELIGKRMHRIHMKSLSWVDRMKFSNKLQIGYWQTVYYFDPNIVYNYSIFSKDTKLRVLADEYMDHYAGVKSKLMQSFPIKN